jgi:hypothetical protein
VTRSAHERKFHHRGDDVVGRWDVVEVVLGGRPRGGNPFKDVSLAAELVAPSGRATRVGGFYDGQNSWKARGCPDEVGEWRWSARLTGPGLAEERAGTFRCVASENAGPLRPHPENGHYLADASGRTVYLFGLRSFWPAEPWYVDGLKHERPADPWSDLDAVRYADTRTSTYTTEDFLQDLADHGMNYLAMDTAHIGRFATPHNTLWPRSGFDARGNAIYDVRDRYDLAFASRLDQIVRHAGRLGIHVRLIPICGCVFWESSPLAASNGGPCQEKEAIFDCPAVYPILDDYYQYVIDRYAAFPNVHWEVGNEIWNFNRQTYRAFNDRMVRFFRDRDPFGRMVAADDQGDVVSFHLGHSDPAQLPALEPTADERGMRRSFSRRLVRTGQMWYPSGDEYGVDVVAYERALALRREHGKFVQLDELLLRGRNYQRIASWALLMAGGSVSAMDHPKYEIHTDPAVMDDRLHLSRFAAGLDLPAMAPAPERILAVDATRLRVYALASERELALYVHHFADHARPCVDEAIGVALPPGAHVARHLDPASGRWIGSSRLAGGEAAVPLPEFTVDQVVSISPEQA